MFYNIQQVSFENFFYFNYYIFSNNYCYMPSNIENIGIILYNNFYFFFLFCGFILFVSLIICIVISLQISKKYKSKQQSIKEQIFRNNHNSVIYYY
jgi:hypothetical protein